MDLASFSINEVSGIRTVRINGEVDLSNAAHLRALLDAACSPPAHTVAVDLSSCDYMDSTGLSALVAFRKRLGRAFPVVIPPASFLRKVFAITRVDSVLCVHDDVSGLRDHFVGPRATCIAGG
jgi:anti-anti-sigma factor